MYRFPLLSEFLIPILMYMYIQMHFSLETYTKYEASITDWGEYNVGLPCVCFARESRQCIFTAVHNGQGACVFAITFVASRARILPYWCNAIALPSLHNCGVGWRIAIMQAVGVYLARSRFYPVSSVESFLPSLPFVLSSLSFLKILFSLILFSPLHYMPTDCLEFRNSIGGLKVRFSHSRRATDNENSI